MATDDGRKEATVQVRVINVERGNFQRKRRMIFTRICSGALWVRLPLLVSVPHALVDLRFMGAVSEMVKTGSVAEYHLDVHCVQGIVQGKFDGTMIMYDTEFYQISYKNKRSVLGHVARSPRNLASTRNSGVGLDMRAG